MFIKEYSVIKESNENASEQEIKASSQEAESTVEKEEPTQSKKPKKTSPILSHELKNQYIIFAGITVVCIGMLWWLFYDIP